MNGLIQVGGIINPLYGRNPLALPRPPLLPIARQWPLPAPCGTFLNHDLCNNGCCPRDAHSHPHSHSGSPFNPKHRCDSLSRGRDHCLRDRSCSCHRCRSRERSCSRDRHSLFNSRVRCHSRERRSCSCLPNEKCYCAFESPRWEHFRLKVAADRLDLYRLGTSYEIVIHRDWSIDDIYDYIAAREGPDIEIIVEMRGGRREPLGLFNLDNLYWLTKDGNVEGLVFEKRAGGLLGLGLGRRGMN